LLDKTQAKYHHAKGLAFQSESEQAAKKEHRDLALEDSLVCRAIECFGDALVCDHGFTSSMFHQGLMYRRTGNFN
jgi:hypothetical protein